MPMICSSLNLARYSVSDFRRMLDRLGVDLTLEVVEAPR